MFYKHGHTAGGKRSPEHRAWSACIKRCHNPADADYYKYGERGISVCARWRASFEAFFADMGPRPSNRHSIDRINNDGNYEPGNCRWATASEQLVNRRRCKKYSSRVKGVHFHTQTGKWKARVSDSGRRVHLGTFDTEEAAAAAVLEALRDPK